MSNKKRPGGYPHTTTGPAPYAYEEAMMQAKFIKSTRTTHYIKFILQRLGFDRPGEQDAFQRALEQQAAQQWARRTGGNYGE